MISLRREEVGAALSGANRWVEVEMFGLAKERWFCKQLALAHGIPSRGTFGRVFSQIDPTAQMVCLKLGAIDDPIVAS